MQVEERAFLAAIRSQPLDPTPRLVYAGWLEERGDPLAEVIRAQVERSQHVHSRAWKA